MEELLISQKFRLDTLNSSHRNFWRLLIIIVGLFVGVFIVRDAKAQELEQTLLWKIEGKEIQPSYIYGTFHLLPQKDFVLKEKVSRAFDESEQIVLELDMDDPNMQMKVMENASMNGQTLDLLLSEDDYNMIDRVLMSTVGASLDDYNTVKPVILSSLLIPTLLDGLPASFELTFVQMATEKNKEILGLETVKEQMEAFDRIPYKDQLEDILEIVNERDRMRSLFNEMIEIYKNEDIKAMNAVISKYMNGENELEYVLLERNRNWISRIGELSKEKSSFFGVGAGHIGGEEGVINLLKEDGYIVTPIF